MTRQLAVGTTPPSPAVLENRIRELEARTARLTEVIRLLTHAMENHPLAGPGDGPISEAARKAHELLMAPR
jgi:hypothetical protein